MLEGVICPRIKNKYGNLKCSDNYREVMISTVMLKTFDYLISPDLKSFTSLSKFQFAYRPGSSTTLATAVLK